VIFDMPEIRQLLSLEYGAALPAELRSGDGYPVYGSSGEVGRHATPLVGGPGIVVGRKGSVGKVSWSDQPFWPIDTSYWVNCADQDKRWIYWLLSSLPLAELDSSTGIPGLNRNDVYELNIFEPPNAEKRPLVQVLDTLDTTIRQTEAIIAKLKQVKQGLLHDLLTRGIDANGELRPPPSEAPHLYKASPLGRIPDEWTVKSLEACSVKITDRDHTTPVYLREGVMMISPTNLFDEDGIDFDSAKRISPRAHEINRKKTDLKPGDLIIHRIGAGLGRVRLITADMPPFSILHSMAQIRPDLAAMQSEFMLWALRTHATQLQIEHGTQSIGVPDLGLDKIGSILVVAPPLDEQRRIVVPLVAHKAKLAAATSELGKLRKLKSGLMDDLLTGRIRVTPLLAQPAAT
jgi:type I restriction enzyme S subunit